MKEPSFNINLAVVGAKGVGKSALTVRFLTRRFIGEYDSNADVCINREMNIAGKFTELRVKDTAGCDWLKGPSALIGWASAIVIVYSVTDAKSFDLATFMLENLNVGKRLDHGCIMLLGNKNDLEHLREVSENDGKQLAKYYGTHFQETSAANDFEGVDSAFRRLLFEALSAQLSKVRTSPESINNGIRKLSLVARDHPERRSLRRVTRRISIGSHDTTRDSLSSTSDDERILVTLSEQSTHSLSSSSSSPQNSPRVSPTLSGKRRKISLPVLFEKIGRHYHSQKYNYVKGR